MKWLVKNTAKDSARAILNNNLMKARRCVIFINVRVIQKNDVSADIVQSNLKNLFLTEFKTR